MIRPASSRRGGFTLLEILLSIGLMLLLVGAVAQAMRTYVTLSTLGREEVEQAQIGRAVLQQISRDIRCVFFLEIPEEDLPVEGLGGEEIAAEDGLGLGDDTSGSTAVPPPTGIIGTSTDLIIFVRQPDRRTEYVSREEMTSPKDRVSDARLLQYFLAKTGGDGVSGEFARTSLGPGVVKDVVGLARMDGDQAVLTQALEENQIDMQVECCQLLAREVVELEFAYFSGDEWLDEWDSEEQNKLPRAIEIKISVQLQPEEDRSRFERPDPEVEEQEGFIRKYRRIVQIPVVPPVEIEEEEEL